MPAMLLRGRFASMARSYGVSCVPYGAVAICPMRPVRASEGEAAANRAMDGHMHAEWSSPRSRRRHYAPLTVHRRAWNNPCAARRNNIPTTAQLRGMPCVK